MKWKNKLRLLLIIMSINLCSCFGVDADYNGTTTIEYLNQSSHTIEITDIDVVLRYDMPENIVMEPGATFSFKISEDTGGKPNEGYFAWPYIATADISFDGAFVIRHKDEEAEYHNFCNFNAYAYTWHEDNGAKLTFTFTDADYDYAVEYGEPVERVGQ